MRSVPQTFETRAEGDELYIEGYFSVFNSPYVLWEGAEEIILPGAFDGCMGQDVRALINHDSTLVLGRTRAGTLTLRQDGHGLWGSIAVNRADSDAMNSYARVQRGDVNQCSFGFDIGRERMEVLGDGKYRWVIEEVNPLYEVSVCTFPAYEETGVTARRRQVEQIQARQKAIWRAEMKARIGGR